MLQFAAGTVQNTADPAQTVDLPSPYCSRIMLIRATVLSTLDPSKFPVEGNFGTAGLLFSRKSERP